MVKLRKAQSKKYKQKRSSRASLTSNRNSKYIQPETVVCEKTQARTSNANLSDESNAYFHEMHSKSLWWRRKLLAASEEGNLTGANRALLELTHICLNSYKKASEHMKFFKFIRMLCTPYNYDGEAFGSASTTALHITAKFGNLEMLKAYLSLIIIRRLYGIRKASIRKIIFHKNWTFSEWMNELNFKDKTKMFNYFEFEQWVQTSLKSQEVYNELINKSFSLSEIMSMATIHPFSIPSSLYKTIKKEEKKEMFIGYSFEYNGGRIEQQDDNQVSPRSYKVTVNENQHDDVADCSTSTRNSFTVFDESADECGDDKGNYSDNEWTVADSVTEDFVSLSMEEDCISFSIEEVNSIIAEESQPPDASAWEYISEESSSSAWEELSEEFSDLVNLDTMAYCSDGSTAEWIP